MKKLIGVLLGVLVTLAGQAAAQGPREMIAYDSCQWDYCTVLGMGTGPSNATCTSWRREFRH
jgi:hypothetical protein